ncbi:MAG: hypothetical protein JEY71_12845 [Sphaerochaeta sp.]|nr:hypothetical protein [Sphaerochaeta sp.]
MFSVTIGGNHFSIDRISVDLSFEDLSLKAEVLNHNPTPFPVTLTSPGIMGWFSYVPFMECNHGVVSTHHGLQGTVEINGKPISPLVLPPTLKLPVKAMWTGLS